MIYGITDNQYEIPSIVPINVTILRGSRRLKFSSRLTKKYKDFAPQLWKILTIFHYKKYLQRIYVDVDYQFSIQTISLQLPITLAVLTKLGIIKTRQDVVSYGKVINTKIFLPIQDIQDYIGTFNIKNYPRENENLFKYISRIIKYPSYQIEEKPNWDKILRNLFPQVIVSSNKLDLVRTQNKIINKITPEVLQMIPVIIDLKLLNQVSKGKVEYLQSLPIKNVYIKNKQNINKKILDILKINAWRIEVPFEPS